MDYGRNFDWRQSPDPQHRLARFKTGNAVLRQGMPVIATGAADPLDGRRTVRRAINTDLPVTGSCGILIFEAPWTAYTGVDRALTRASDLDQVPVASPVQVCFGNECKMLVVNTAASNFEGQRAYAGFDKMVDFTGLAIDDLLSPGLDDANDFLWKESADAAHAWARVVNLDAAAGWLEAQLLF